MDFWKNIFFGLLLITILKSGFSKSTTTSIIPSDEDYVEDDDYQYPDEDENISGGHDKVMPGVKDNNVIPDSTILPFFKFPEYKKIAEIGGTVILECDVQNLKPSNVIMWYKNHTKLLFQAKHRITADKHMSMDNNSLVIENIQENDESDYVCTVLPDHIRMIAKLELIKKPIAKIFNGEREVTGLTETYNQGGHIEVTCKGYGKPVPIIKWFTDGDRVESIAGIHVNNGKMIIEHADYNHVRVYQCTADNSYGIHHVSYNVQILHSPKVLAHHHHVNAKQGGDAELHCNFRSFTNAKIEWRKHKTGEIIDATRNAHKYQILNHGNKIEKPEKHNITILIIKNVDISDLGPYECSIKNNIGKSHAIVNLAYEPEPPFLKHSHIDKTDVVTEWQVKSHLPLNEVMLNYQKDGSSHWFKEEPIFDKKPLTEHTGVWLIKHKLELEPGFWHTRVKAHNDAGWSEYSSLESFRIKNDTVNGNLYEHDLLQVEEKKPANNTKGAATRLAQNLNKIMFTIVPTITLFRIFTRSLL